MTLLEYAQKTNSTDIYPQDVKPFIYCLGMVDELGEVSGKIKKNIRDTNAEVTPEFLTAIKLELGDVLWYLTQFMNYQKYDITNLESSISVVGITVDKFGYIGKLSKQISKLFRVTSNDNRAVCFKIFSHIAKLASCYSISLSDIFEANIEKLAKRKENNTIKGSGDNR